jgi:1-deoxy-D-xylulose 5-phosphate reductoisomerase
LPFEVQCSGVRRPTQLTATIDRVPVTAAFPPITAPTNDELATKLDQVAQRADDAIAAAQADARSAADSARNIAVIALLVGLIGVIAAIAALATRKRA